MTDKTITVHLHQQADYRFDIRFDDTMPVLTSDEPAPLGTGLGPSPVQLLCAAVGNCLSDSLLFAFRKFKQAPEPIQCEVQAVIGRNEQARALLDPFLQLMRPIPVTAWLPLSMILFGLGPRSAFFLVFLGAFYPILLNTVFGVRSVEKRLFEAASMLGCSGTAQFFRVVLPASLPSIFTGLRLGLGLAWFVIVVGEMTGVPQGLGAVIMDGRTLSRTELVICGMIVIGIAGFISDRVIVAIMNRLLRWSPSHHG